MSFNCKVHESQGGDVYTIESGGALDVKTGGQITANGTQAGAIADQNTGTATAATNAAAINSILAALRGAGVIASS